MTAVIPPAIDPAHVPVGNPRLPLHPKRFYSAPPTTGTMKNPTKVSASGHHEIRGFKLGTATPPSPLAARPVSELTFGPAPVRALAIAPAAGGSGQVPVTDTSKYPWRATAALKITIPGQTDTFYASGWFISPYAVITAAHVVFPRTSSGGQWASGIEVFPGLSGFDNPPPFGSFPSDTFYCPTGWQSDGTPALDYGVVLLSQGIGSSLGSFGYSTYTDSDLRASLANLAGFPLDAPDGTTSGGHLWYGASPVFNVDDSFVYYQLDTREGQSGSCVYRNIGDDSFAMAIHTSASGAVDHGIRITGPVFANLQNWATMHG